MCFVWAALVSVGLLGFIARPVAAAAHASDMAAGLVRVASEYVVADQSSDSEAESIFFDGHFVYVPPPTPLLSTDPKFHREGFRYVPPATTESPPQQANAPPPDLAPVTPSPLPLAPTALPTPIPIATPLPPATLVFGPTPTATPNIRPAYEEPLFHDGVFNLLTGPVATAIVIQNAIPTVAPTHTPTLIPILVPLLAPTHTPARTSILVPILAPTQTPAYLPTVMATVAPGNAWPALFDPLAPYPVAQPAMVSTPTPVPATPVPMTLIPLPTIIASNVTNEMDIEDPRFYRGSFTITPAGSVQADASGGGGSAGPSLYYSGSSYETLNPTYFERSPLPVSGKAMYYNPGIMQQVYAYRLSLGEVQPCAECVGFVALLRKGDLGRRVYLRWADGTVEGPFLVIDVAASHHISLLLQRGWAVDVDYQTAMRRKMYSPVPVTILDSPTIGYPP